MKILLVDDHPIFSEGLALLIKQFNSAYEVNSCSDLDAAREKIRKSSPDIIFLDVEMDGDESAGLKLLDELKEAECESRIVMLSGASDPFTVGQAVASGAVGFIAKSAKDVSAMAEAMELVLEGSVFLSTELRGRRRPPQSSTTVRKSISVKEVGPDDIGVTAERAYEVLWYIANGVKGYKLIAKKMGITKGVAEEYASKAYALMNVEGKDGFFVKLYQNTWKLKTPRGLQPKSK